MHRIRTLVDKWLYKRDPRILRRKEEGKADKQSRKEAKFFGQKGCKKKKLQGLLKRRDARKKRRKNVLLKLALQQKKIKEKEKKHLRKERSPPSHVFQHLFCLSVCSILVKDDVEKSLYVTGGILSSLGVYVTEWMVKKVVEQAKVLRDACGYDHDSSSSTLDEKKDFTAEWLF
ncbi:hypothetical protein NC651_000081 [Populus alba x Populus x berolinensis]|nr:hypothetical protein NC651_000081 [Populus alba x Populus x berolinensis]